MALEHKHGYESIVDLIRYEDIYPGACICIYKGRYFPSVNRVRKVFGNSAVSQTSVIPRTDVRAALSQNFLNI